ncbi:MULTISPECIES: hypothetical protein [Flavobacterium]|uniref:Lipoprotein n=1 Tax=Flavobacterium hankyongi TaxID=1176532 RepID=A0ABP9AAM8_9FLAO|nr:hypothetical protein [Flavobacterium sp. N1846]
MKTKRAITLFLALTLQLLTSCEPKKEADVKMPHNIIPVNKGIMMKQTYNNDIQSIIERNRENGAYQGTEFAWINIDSLKNYIALLDKVSELNNKKITGVRIYFSEYPKTGQYSKEQIANLIPGRETIFFAPTIATASSETSKRFPILEHVPFSIKNTGENKLKGNFEVITRLLSEGERNNTSFQKQKLVEENETSLLLNEVAMFPPPKQ